MFVELLDVYQPRAHLIFESPNGEQIHESELKHTD